MGLRLHNFLKYSIDFCATTARYVSTFNNNHSNIPTCPFFIVDNNFKNSLRSKLSRASFVQETKFVEGKKRGRRGREGLTRAITLLETLVMQARYNIKCFFSLILSFGHRGKFSLNFPGLN